MTEQMPPTGPQYQAPPPQYPQPPQYQAPPPPPQYPQKKKVPPAVWITALVVLVIVVIIGAVASSGSKDEEKSTTSTPATSTSSDKSTSKPSSTPSTTTPPATTTPKSYQTVIEVNASADKKTEPFTITSTQQKLLYYISGDPNFTVVGFYIYKVGSEYSTESSLWTDPGEGESALYLSPGQYYIEIEPANCTVQVTIQEYK